VALSRAGPANSPAPPPLIPSKDAISFRAGRIAHSEAPCSASPSDGAGCTRNRIIQSAAVPVVPGSATSRGTPGTRIEPPAAPER
jgi:hypothetical protein